MDSSFDLATVEAPFFEEQTGQRFTARFLEMPGQEPLELELVAVTAYHHRPAAGGRAPFALLFKTSTQGRLHQGNYECSGPGLARATIFLVPVRDPLRGIGLEAVFN